MPLFIEDARRTQEAVLAAFPNARFVAAAPIHRGSDPVAGVLWVTDAEPREITADLRDQLADFCHMLSLYVHQSADSALYRLVAENSADTLIRGTLDGVRRYVSPSIRTLLGYEAEELVGKRAYDITHPDDADGFGRQMLAMRDGVIDNFTTEHRMRHKDGSWVWIEAFVKVTRNADTGERDGYVVSVRDTSRRKELEATLAHNASHDVLTGLPNRALLYTRLQHEIEKSERSGGRFAVLCLDLDGFKRVNDELGHNVGDLVLAEVAERLVSCVRATDIVARRSGDEFVIIHVTDAPLLESVIVLAHCLIDEVSAPMAISGWSGSIGLSVGIAIADGPVTEGEELLRIADRAMYDAKGSGSNGYRVAGAVD